MLDNIEELQQDIKQICYDILQNYDEDIYLLLEETLNFYAVKKSLQSIFKKYDQTTLMKAAVCHLMQIKTNIEIEQVVHSQTGLRKILGDENIPLIIKILTDIIIIINSQLNNKQIEEIIMHYERHSIQCYCQLLKMKNKKSFDIDIIVNFIQQTRYELPLYMLFSGDQTTDKQLKNKVIRQVGRIIYLNDYDEFLQLKYLQDQKDKFPEQYNEYVIQNQFLKICGYNQVNQDIKDLQQQIDVLIIRLDKQYDILKQFINIL